MAESLASVCRTCTPTHPTNLVPNSKDFPASHSSSSMELTDLENKNCKKGTVVCPHHGLSSPKLKGFLWLPAMEEVSHVLPRSTFIFISVHGMFQLRIWFIQASDEWRVVRPEKSLVCLIGDKWRILAPYCWGTGWWWGVAHFHKALSLSSQPQIPLSVKTWLHLPIQLAHSLFNSPLTLAALLSRCSCPYPSFLESFTSIWVTEHLLCDTSPLSDVYKYNNKTKIPLCAAWIRRVINK